MMVKSKTVNRVSSISASTSANVTSNKGLVMAAAMLAVSLFGFFALSREVANGKTKDFDQWGVRILRDANDLTKTVGPEWLGEVGRDITALGSVSVLLLFIVGTTGFLAVYRLGWTSAAFLAVTVGGMTISLILKNIFGRPRPNLVPHLSEVFTSSFPSGHAMMSAVVYFSLIAVVVPVLTHRRLRIYVISLALVLVISVGVSRVFMGVHYPTDVFGGWLAGAAWVAICWIVGWFASARRRQTNS